MKIAKDLLKSASKYFTAFFGGDQSEPKNERRVEDEELTISGKDGDVNEKVEGLRKQKEKDASSKKEAEIKAKSEKPQSVVQPKPEVKSEPKGVKEEVTPRAKVKAEPKAKATPKKPASKAKAAPKKPASKAKAAPKAKAKPAAKKETLLADTGLSASVKKSLEAAGLKTVEEMKKMSDEEILAIKGVGQGTLDKIKAL